jgi:hypothetical protein
MFSAFMLDSVHGWVATHRLPLSTAIHYCQEYRKQHYRCPVALVPDHEDPTPYLMLAEIQARKLHQLERMMPCSV